METPITERSKFNLEIHSERVQELLHSFSASYSEFSRDTSDHSADKKTADSMQRQTFLAYVDCLERIKSRLHDMQISARPENLGHGFLFAIFSPLFT